MKNEEKKIIGYQIKSSDGKERYPERWFKNRDVLATDTLAITWLKKYSDGQPERWKMVPVYEGEIDDMRILYTLG
jgi:hypothetical protein